MKVLAIDLGASSGRCMVVNYDQGKIDYKEINRFKNILVKEDGFLRWDISYLITNIIDGIKMAFRQYHDIESIGIDTWGVDYCLLDCDGNLIENPISYRDTRTQNIIDETSKILSFRSIYQTTGIQYLHFNSIFQLYHDFNHRKSIATKIDKILMIPDYIAYVLTNELRLEITNVSTMGLLNHKTKEIDDFLLKEFNIKKSIFPKIIRPGDKYGYLKEDISCFNDNNKIPVYAVCSHDTASAVLGMPITNNSIFISSGTWSLLGVELDSPFVSDDTLKYGFTNELGYRYTVDFLKNITGMFIINQLLDEWKALGEDVNVQSIERIIDDSPNYVGFVDVDDTLLSTPNNMVLKIKKYLKKTSQFLPVFKGQWLDLIYISMAAKYKFFIDRLLKIINRPINEIMICGGGSQANILNQYIANFTNLKVVQGPIEATILGNALVQFIATGSILNMEEGRKIIDSNFKQKVYIPKDVEIFKQKYELYKSITGLGDSDNE